MKKIFLTFSIISFFLLILLMLILSTIGIETNKFNKLIEDKAGENNQNVFLKLEKVKFKFDIKSFNLFLETENPELKYKELAIPIQKIKVYLNFVSLVKSQSKIDKIKISSKEINIDQLQKIIVKTKPSNLNSLISNKVKYGILNMNLELFFNDNLKIDNFIAKGEVKKMNGIIHKDLNLNDTSFSFFADASDILIKNVKSELEGISIKNGTLQIKNNKEIEIETNFVTEINVNNKNISNYLPLIKKSKFINEETKFDANLENFLKITFDKTFKVMDYDYTNKGKINKLTLKFVSPFKNDLLEKEIKNLYFKDSILSTRFASDNKNHIQVSGLYSLYDKDYQNYNLKSNFLNKLSDINLNFGFKQNLNIDFINYNKSSDKVAEILLDIGLKDNLLDLRELQYSEGKNAISIKKLIIKKNDLISVKKFKVKTFDKNRLKNDFTLAIENKINISGNKYDATNLNKLLNKKSKKNVFKKLSKDITIDLQNIETPLSKKLKDFRLIGTIKKGKFIKISSKGDFGNNKFLDISMKSDKDNKKKYLEIYSDLPQPLLSEYSFFKGLSEGTLTFSTIIEEKVSSSKLTIEKFKLVNAPGVVRLLSLADFGGLADLAEGEGLSFDKMEINMNNNNGFLNLNELYAVGPSISVLMEGYLAENGLTSLRGTLVPAKNLNKFLSKIPVIGKIIIPEEVGEGLFGVSFKMKGMPGKIKTTINPIKTLTPRFITKALERSKQSK